MPAKTPSQKKVENNSFEKSRRRNQVLFAILAVILILSWIISLVAQV